VIGTCWGYNRSMQVGIEERGIDKSLLAHMLLYETKKDLRKQSKPVGITQGIVKSTLTTNAEPLLSLSIASVCQSYPELYHRVPLVFCCVRLQINISSDKDHRVHLPLFTYYWRRRRGRESGVHDKLQTRLSWHSKNLRDLKERCKCSYGMSSKHTQ
jgi:hypothetical protein